MKFIVKSWKQFVCGCFVFTIVFALLAVAGMRRQQNRDYIQFNTHAEIIKNDLWALSKSGARSYLQLAVQADHYKSIVVLLEGGAPFLAVVSPPLTGMDKLLHSLHLLPLKKLNTDIKYHGRLIGTLQGEKYVRIIYPLLNIFVVLFLFMLTTLFIINLMYSQRLLEQQVSERTQKHLESKRRFQDLVNLLPEMVCETDLQGRLIYANQLTLKRLNINNFDLLGTSIFDYLIPEQRDQARQKFSSIIRGDDQRLSEYTACTSTGETFPTLTRSAPIYTDNHVSGVRSVIIDISERHTLEKQLRRAQRMEVIGLMASGVAHDLNNILSGVINYPELILNKLPRDSELRDQVNAIKKSGLRAAEVVEDLLTVSRGVAASRIIASPNAMVTDYMNSPEFLQLQSLHPGISWQRELDPEVANISCSGTHVNKSIMNLVTNAAEAIKDCGQVTISTTSRQQGDTDPGDEDKILQKQQWSVISIHDSGPGIAAEDLKHIFEPFYTKKVMGKSGTGLGLTIVWNTVQDHDGEIRVSSSENGTTFSLYFPSTDQPAEQPAPAKGLTVVMGNGEKILVIDDNRQQQDIAMQLLTSLNYRVNAVSSGEEAVEYLRTRFAHLLLLDMLMPPGMNGLETYKQILAIHPGQKAVIASGFSESRDVRQALELGAAAFIKKPYEMEQLGQTVYTALH